MTEKYYYEKEWSKHMWKAENWKDYEVLDTGNGEKLERWGDYLLVRPDPQVIWNSPRRHPGWSKRTDIITAAARAAANGNFLIFPRNGASITVISPSG